MDGRKPFADVRKEAGGHVDPWELLIEAMVAFYAEVTALMEDEHSPGTGMLRNSSKQWVWKTTLLIGILFGSSTNQKVTK